MQARVVLPQGYTAKGPLRVWGAYTHIPGGQVVVTHFDTVVLNKREGEKDVPIVIEAIDKFEAFQKGDYVGLKLAGKEFQKNKALMFPLDKDLGMLPDPAGAVLAWAYQQGIEATTPKPVPPALPAQQSQEVDGLKKDVATLSDQVKEAMTQNAALLAQNAELLKRLDAKTPA